MLFLYKVIVKKSLVVGETFRVDEEKLIVGLGWNVLSVGRGFGVGGGGGGGCLNMSFGFGGGGGGIGAPLWHSIAIITLRHMINIEIIFIFNL